MSKTPVSQPRSLSADSRNTGGMDRIRLGRGVLVDPLVDDDSEVSN